MHIFWGKKYLASVECFGKTDVNIIFEEIWIALDALWQSGRTSVWHGVIKEAVKMNIIHTLK